MPNHEQKHVQAQVESEVQSQQEGRRMPNHEQKHVQAQVESEVQSQQEGRRKAWRGMLIPAVGSAAFFTSTLLGIFSYLSATVIDYYNPTPNKI